jgi:hypothetical protein
MTAQMRSGAPVPASTRRELASRACLLDAAVGQAPCRRMAGAKALSEVADVPFFRGVVRYIAFALSVAKQDEVHGHRHRVAPASGASSSWTTRMGRSPGGRQLPTGVSSRS